MERNAHDPNHVLSVEDLTRQIKRLLEGNFGRIWVEGEITNLARPRSGHLYFSLNDGNASLSGVMFRNSASHVRIPLQDGLRVQCYGRISVYEPHGKYQIIVDTMRSAGDGHLLATLQALKARLQAEGLFDPAHKKPLPVLPQRIGVVTSPTGAAIRDIIRSIHDRFPVPLLVYPCRVQGDGSAEEIAQGIRTLDAMEDVDVIIVGRGGGSLEDLWAFNKEEVVRAIHEANTPVVSAVGHEVDILLSDFVADVRAPTPTGVAPLVVPSLADLREGLAAKEHHIQSAMESRIQHSRQMLLLRRSRLRDPQQLLERGHLQLDDARQRLEGALRYHLLDRKSHMSRLVTQLRGLHPARAIETGRHRLHESSLRLCKALERQLAQRREAIALAHARLDALGPTRVLKRGYAIVQSDQDGGLIRSPEDAPASSALRIRLHGGTLAATSMGEHTPDS